MKVLVIPDVHLKPWMFERAEEIMKKKMAERAVCLMDIPDDWNQEYNLELYPGYLRRRDRICKEISGYPLVLRQPRPELSVE